MSKNKVSGSFRMCPHIKKAIADKAKEENRSFSNMLEELAKRQFNISNEGNKNVN